MGWNNTEDTEPLKFRVNREAYVDLTHKAHTAEATGVVSKTPWLVVMVRNNLKLASMQGVELSFKVRSAYFGEKSYERLFDKLNDHLKKLKADETALYQGCHSFTDKIASFFSMSAFKFRFNKMSLFFEATMSTLPKIERKHWLPLYWVSMAVSYLTTWCEGLLRSIADYFFYPTDYFWQKANNHCFPKKFNGEFLDKDAHKILIQSDTDKIISNLKMAGLFVLWLCTIVFPISWYIGKTLTLMADTLAHVRHFIDAVVELVMSLTSPLWVMFSGIKEGIHSLLHYCLPNWVGQPSERLFFKDFSLLSAFKEVILRALLLIPTAFVLAITIMPGLGQLLGATLALFLNDISLWLSEMIRPLTQFILLAPPALFIQQKISKLDDKIDSAIVQCSTFEPPWDESIKPSRLKVQSQPKPTPIFTQDTGNNHAAGSSKISKKRTDSTGGFNVGGNTRFSWLANKSEPSVDPDDDQNSDDGEDFVLIPADNQSSSTSPEARR